MTLMLDRRQTRTEEAVSTIPSTWLALANEIKRQRGTYRENAALELAKLILEASDDRP